MPALIIGSKWYSPTPPPKTYWVLFNFPSFLKPWELTNSTYEGFTILCGLVALYPEFCLNSRRLEDLDKPPQMAYWLAGVGAIAVISSTSFESGKGAILGLIYLVAALYLLFAEGTRGDNQYGPDPLGRK